MITSHSDTRIRVVIAERIPAIQVGARLSLSDCADIEVCAVVDDIGSAVDSAVKSKAKVVLADVGDDDDSVHLSELQARDIAIVAFSSSENPTYAAWLLDLGVKGFLLKSATISDICSAVRTVGRGGSYIAPNMAMSIMQARAKTASGEAKLTQREGEIARVLAHGKTVKFIANDLGLSVKTVDAHKARLFKKLEVHSTPELVLRAVRMGWIDAHSEHTQ